VANRKEIGKTPTLKTIPKQPNPARNPAQIQYQTGPALPPLTLSLGPAPQPNTARPALGPSAWPQASSGARVVFPAGPRPARALSPAPVPARAFPHAQAHHQQLTAHGPLSPRRLSPSLTGRPHRSSPSPRPPLAQQPRSSRRDSRWLPSGARLPKITDPRYKRCPHPGNLSSPLQRRPNPSRHAVQLRLAEQRTAPPCFRRSTAPKLLQTAASTPPRHQEAI